MTDTVDHDPCPLAGQVSEIPLLDATTVDWQDPRRLVRSRRTSGNQILSRAISSRGWNQHARGEPENLIHRPHKVAGGLSLAV